jgi:flagellar hook assembly protein FlgD
VQDAGSFTHSWNGTDDSGKAVSSGIYFYRLQADGVTQTRKMMLMK